MRPRVIFFFFNDTATTEIYPLSLHDALPIYIEALCKQAGFSVSTEELVLRQEGGEPVQGFVDTRSEEHTSELQSRLHLVCRLLLEKKKSTDHTCRITVCSRASGCGPVFVCVA